MVIPPAMSGEFLKLYNTFGYEGIEHAFIKVCESPFWKNASMKLTFPQFLREDIFTKAYGGYYDEKFTNERKPLTQDNQKQSEGGLTDTQKLKNAIEEERYRNWRIKPKYYSDVTIEPFDRDYTDADARNEYLYNSLPPRCLKSRQEKQKIIHHEEKGASEYKVEVSELERMLHVAYCKLKGKPILDKYLPVSAVVEWVPV